jgi:hypothetical protein
MHCRRSQEMTPSPWYARSRGDGARAPWYVWCALASVALGVTGVALGESPLSLAVPAVVMGFAILAWS